MTREADMVPMRRDGGGGTAGGFARSGRGPQVLLQRAARINFLFEKAVYGRQITSGKRVSVTG